MLSATLFTKDQTWIGNITNDEKPPNTFRLVYNNINGLGSTKYQQTIQDLAATQQQLGIDYFGITEHCINSNDVRVQQNLHSALRQYHLGNYTLQLNSSSMATTTSYLPGGTAALIMGHTIGRIETNGKNGDSMGRWSFVTFRRRSLPPLTIYTVYQVNPTPTNEIGITAWHQQRLHLNATNRPNIHPRQAFTLDLIQSIKTHQQLSHDIILGGDFNDTITRTRSNVLRIATSTGLVDPWHTLHPAIQEDFSSYSRGSSRIDSILCTPSIVPLINNYSYSPYHWLTTSDHRAIVIEFDDTMLFGCGPNPIPPASLRGIRTNDRQQVATFIHQWHKHLASNGVFQSSNNQNTRITHEEIETLDRLIGQGGDSAEKLCKRRRPTMYSTKLSQLRFIKRIMIGNLRTLRDNKRHTPTFQARIHRHGLTTELATTIDEAKRQLAAAAAELDIHEQKHIETRQHEQEIRTGHAILRNQAQEQKRLIGIQRREARRRTWQILQHSSRGTTSTKFDQLEIPTSWPLPNAPLPSIGTLEDPKECSEWTTITNPNDIEYYIQLRNRSHFGQAQGTPFTEQPFVESLDWAASTSICDELLNGQFPTDITKVPQCQALLDTCRTISDLDIIPANITTDDFRGKIRSWKETTSTSPSGRHLGRYKALYAKGPYEKNNPDHQEQYIQFHKEQTDIITAIVTVINSCITTGYILERWKTIINTMIFKEPNNFKIHRLRVIHIYEADFNLILAIKWRQLLHSAEDRNALHPGLFGGRPGCEAQSLTFLEEIKYDISYTSRRSLFNFDNDATSCYDRIIVSLASLINRRFGQHRQVVTIHAHTLQSAKFHLRTRLGFTESSYSHCIQYPIYGSGQGSGNSPSIWLFISSTLCDVHDSSAKGATFTSQDGTISARITMVGFVDDSTGLCNDFRPQKQDDLPTLALKMQNDAQVWNDLLWCSGGRLELPKCSFHALHFEFLPNGEPRPVLDIDHIISVLDSETKLPIPIPSKRSTDAHKTLGHWKSPVEPKRSRQLQAILHQATAVSLQISTSPVSRFGALIAYFGQYLPGLKYVLPQCFFTATQLYQAERQTLQPIVAKAGFNRNIATQLRYGPPRFAGCGFVKWYTLQGEGQVQLFLKHWRTDTIISKILRIAVSWTQWQAGISKPFLSDTRTPLPHLECRWLSSLRVFLRSINSTITPDDPHTIPIERLGDQHIMEYAIRCKTFKPPDIKIINYCRLYLHVTTMSELFDTTGTRIIPHMFRCVRPAWFDTTRYITLQKKPSDHQIRKIWQRLCREWSTEDGRIARSLHLGKWELPQHHLHSRRETYFSDSTSSYLYHWIDSSYWLLSPIPAKTGYFQPTKTTDWTPDNSAIPTTILRIPSSTQVSYYLPDRSPYDTQPRSTTANINRPIDPTLSFTRFRINLPPWEQQLQHSTTIEPDSAFWDHTDHSQPETAIWYLTFAGTIHNTQGHYCWALTDDDGITIAQGHDYITDKAMTSHRSAQYGQLSALLFLSYLPQVYPTRMTQRTNVIIASSNPTAIKTTTKRNHYCTSHPNATLKDDWDITEQIYRTKSSMTEKFEIMWKTIPHAKTTDITPDWSEHLITKCLQALKSTIENDKSTPNLPVKHPMNLPTTQCTFRIKHQAIHGNYIHRIRDAASSPDLLSYLRAKYKWTKHTANSIQWEWFNSATSKYKIKRNHLTKLVYDQLPTLANKNKYGGQSWLPSECRHCQQSPETFEHLTKCNQPTSQKFRTNLIQAVTTLCLTRSIPKEFRLALIGSIKDWYASRPPRLPHDSEPELKRLQKMQGDIGWNRFLLGFLTIQWKTYLHHCYQQQSRCPQPCTINSFFTTLIYTFWHHQTTFWMTYQDHIHNPAKGENRMKETITNLQHEVRYLFTLRNNVTHDQRGQYFPTNLKQFLRKSNITQLKNYLLNYKQPILLSVHAERQRIANLRSIWSFPGFNRLKVTTQRTHRPTTHQNTTLLRDDMLQTTLRENIPHKHSKWKNISGAQKKFWAFFTHTSP